MGEWKVYKKKRRENEQEREGGRERKKMQEWRSILHWGQLVKRSDANPLRAANESPPFEPHPQGL